MSSLPAPVVELPCVVQIGFAGSRHPFSERPDRDLLLEELTRYLAHRLKSLRGDLNLNDDHFFCGISQVAIGCDFAFSKACRAAEIPQRFFLPQNRDDFLKAVDLDTAQPDFSPVERTEALALLDSPHAIQERLVSFSADRTERFQDALMELLRVSDLVICVIPATEPAIPAPSAAITDTPPEITRGGTAELLYHAIKRGKPALELRVAAEGGRATVVETKHHFDKFVTPRLPGELAGAKCPTSPLPESGAFLEAIQAFTDHQANTHKKKFVRIALWIIVAHLLATGFATIAMAASHHRVPGVGDPQMPTLLVAFLILEIICLLFGFHNHRQFNNSEPGRVWALSRLVDGISKSVIAIGNYPLYLHHLLLLPFPHRLRALLRTINVLHLRTAREHPEHWKVVRDRYVQMRLLDPEKGQIPWLMGKVKHNQIRYGRTRKVFLSCTFLAIATAIVKLAAILASHQLDWHRMDELLPIFGVLAIVLPVIAVASLSWGLALTYEALLHTYHETVEFLNGSPDEPLPPGERHGGHARRLKNAQTEAEFRTLLIETEARLLGENLNFYYRQSFAEVV